MSGHSKWNTIKRAKGVADAKRGKIFTRHAKNIEIAARGGKDPTMNAILSAAIDVAKNDNLPKENIERAIKKGCGELVGNITEEKQYEGYGPGGVAFLICALTDNPNRTIANVRHILSKHDGKIAESGSVAFQFKQHGLITVENATDDNELAAIDAGATETECIEDILLVKTDPKNLMAVRKKLLDKGIVVKTAELVFEPTNEIKIKDANTARKILQLVETLEEDEDVDSVATNFDIPDELLFE